jgi:hypothetical protein
LLQAFAQALSAPRRRRVGDNETLYKGKKLSPVMMVGTGAEKRGEKGWNQ